ncbi:hypothetical protein [Tessaracoccus flavescens]|uniref:Uncharacterized protein n=1 Tax=Tessaracoccus flavescens TaxID=399497 RepID=A0A1Q2D1J3_9ACTN|nr:hypothetical protein [Tessaracoccus flavescens]AQP52266.1 hypothetical protein BW733_16995 [Tessaracoccus flavescens]
MARTRSAFVDKVKRTVAMETDIYERLAKMAGAQRRSISSQMETLIEDGVLRWEKEKRREEAKAR